jgi:phosphoglycerate dehydrogenase-like enzyme
MRLLIAEQQYSAYAALLQQAEPTLELCVGSTLEQLSPHAASCELWLGQPDLLAELLRAGFTPRWLQSTWAGITPLLAAELPRDYCLTRAVGIFGQLMAEYLLTYMLAHERQLLERQASQQARHWDGRAAQGLAGRRVVLVGVGEIGSEVAQLFSAFKLQLFGVASRPREQAPFQSVQGLAQLQQLAAQADYLINLLPDTPTTHNLFDAQLFAQLPAHALFINAGRGAAVVDTDLVSALRSGALGAAVIDVCRQEPLPTSHAFWTAPRLMLTGHSAAATLPAPMVELFVHNLRALRAGTPLRGQVDFTRGY